MEPKLKVVKSARMSTVCRFCLWQYGIGNIELMGGGRWAMANGRLGASPKDNMCDSWRWLPRMITEITISGPRNKKKKKCAASAASERVNKWQPKLWRYCQNKCEAIYEIFMKCDMADNKYIYGQRSLRAHPTHKFSRFDRNRLQLALTSDASQGQIRIFLWALIKMRIKRADVITWPTDWWLCFVCRFATASFVRWDESPGVHGSENLGWGAQKTSQRRQELQFVQLTKFL